MSRSAYMTIRLLPSTLIILAVQFGMQLWLMKRAMPPFLVASMTVSSSIRNEITAADAALKVSVLAKLSNLLPDFPRRHTQ